MTNSHFVYLLTYVLKAARQQVTLVVGRKTAPSPRPGKSLPRSESNLSTKTDFSAFDEGALLPVLSEDGGGDSGFNLEQASKSSRQFSTKLEDGLLDEEELQRRFGNVELTPEEREKELAAIEFEKQWTGHVSVSITHSPPFRNSFESFLRVRSCLCIF